MLKAELRQKYIALRKQLSPEEVQEKSAQICEIVFDTLDFKALKTVHLFLPIAKFNEINTWLIVHKIWESYPYIRLVTSLTTPEKLEHTMFTKHTVFEDSKWGIPTPKEIHPITEHEIDLVLVPLLAFDKALNRVGYGKGYYDGFLSKCEKKCLKIGLSLFDSPEIIADLHQNDVALDKIITPKGVVKA